MPVSLVNAAAVPTFSNADSDCNATVGLMLRSYRSSYIKSLDMESKDDFSWPSFFPLKNYRFYVKHLKISFMSKEQLILVDALEEKLINLIFLYKNYVSKSQENLERFQKSVISLDDAEYSFYQKFNKHCSSTIIRSKNPSRKYNY